MIFVSIFVFSDPKLANRGYFEKIFYPVHREARSKFIIENNCDVTGLHTMHLGSRSLNHKVYLTT